MSFMTDDLEESRHTRAAFYLFASIAFLIGWDVIADYQEGAHFEHIAFELFILLAAAGGVLLLWHQLYQTKADLVQARVETAQWRRENGELIQGLGMAINKQFIIWHATKAEAEVGLFLLKGLSLKEIAQIRQTSERTIREQARALYRKSGLSGRSELSAFFLEDLLLPWSEDADQE
jgi:DNA-binding CsgD family transcriptional regulator